MLKCLRCVSMASGIGCLVLVPVECSDGPVSDSFATRNQGACSCGGLSLHEIGVFHAGSVLKQQPNSYISRHFHTYGPPFRKYRDTMLMSSCEFAGVPVLDSHISASNTKTYTRKTQDTTRNFPLSCAASLTRKKSQNTLDKIRQSVQGGLISSFTRASSQQQMQPASHQKIIITRSSSWHSNNSLASRNKMQTAPSQRYASPQAPVNWQQQKNTSVENVFAAGVPRKSLYHRQHDTDLITARQNSMIALRAESHSACATARPAPVEEKTRYTENKKRRVYRFIGRLWRCIYSYS